jgi:DNA-binding transcriptional ArsR family regulator
MASAVQGHQPNLSAADGRPTGRSGQIVDEADGLAAGLVGTLGKMTDLEPAIIEGELLHYRTVLAVAVLDARDRHVTELVFEKLDRAVTARAQAGEHGARVVTSGDAGLDERRRGAPDAGGDMEIVELGTPRTASPARLPPLRTRPHDHVCNARADTCILVHMSLLDSSAEAPDASLERISSRLIEHDEAVRLAELFKLIGEPSRARILHALLIAGELRVGELAVVCGIAETSTSHALRLLRTAGAVRSRRDGRSVIYRLDDDHVRAVLDLTIEHVRHHDPDTE